jgi:transcription elongation factor Elf1
MAGPIGIAVHRAIRAVTCPHCGAKQARARALTGTIKCKVCKKPFEIEAAPAAKPKRSNR